MNKRKILLTIFSFILVIAAGILIGLLIFNRPTDNGYRIKSLMAGDITVAKPSDFSKSRLNLYANGTFDIKIIYSHEQSDDIHFVANGIYQKTKQNGQDAFIFIYLNCYTPNSSGTLMESTGYTQNNNEENPFIYLISGKSIEFVEKDTGRGYYFAR